MSAGPTSETPRPSQHRADWYPDPTQRYEFRYHNGQDWTGDVSVDGNRYLDPLPRPATEGAGTSVPATAVAPLGQNNGGQNNGGQTGVRAGRSSKATAAMVLGIGSIATGWVPFVFVISAAAAVVALVLGVSTLRRNRRDQIADSRSRGFALAGVILAPIGLATCLVGTWLTVLAYREVDKFANAGDFDLRETSCTVDAGVATYTGTITNLSDDVRDYHLTVEFRRPDTSSVLYRSSVDVDGVAPGEAATWSVDEIVNHDELDCRVDHVSGPLPFNQS